MIKSENKLHIASKHPNSWTLLLFDIVFISYVTYSSIVYVTLPYKYKMLKFGRNVANKV